MTKIKYIIYILLVTVLLVSCDTNQGSGITFDAEAQALIDKESLIKFLTHNYYDNSIDSIKPLIPGSGNTPLINDNNLKTQVFTENDIEYNLYIYIKDIGSPDVDKGFPSVMDSVLSLYQGKTILDSVNVSTFETRTSPIWFSLNSVIRGWTYGFRNFKNGNIVKDENGNPPNGPITYTDPGKGVLIIPSGLAYGFNPNNSLSNRNLMFYITLLDFVENTDADNDSVSSIKEDPDGDGDPRNDDTDGDGVPNYIDRDDDGDGVLTKDEDKNGDGDPTNDFNDPNNPTLPDYLNIKVN